MASPAVSMNFDLTIFATISMDVNMAYAGGVSTITLLPVIDVAACCSPLTREPISVEQAVDLARSLKALADPTRLRLVSIVAAADGGEVCACDLTGPTGLGQPTVSHHLKILTEAGFFKRTQRGTWAYFSLVPGALDSVGNLLLTA
jgi:ArsR family transcriptional regulator, arsenate/arsenite/antimonite-responsive transcriptional repressor